MKIIIAPEIARVAPDLRILKVEATVKNSPTSDSLSREIGIAGEIVASSYELSWISHHPAIAATRAAYKSLGKEPNRYRPSAEALYRRIVQGKGLYRVNTLVDLINLLSVSTGYSIGGFDADKIAGDTLALGVGRKGEEFEAIGRGPLNIEFLPVYRDAVSGIGTPTSDCERTKLSEDTTHLLMLVNIYGESVSPEQTIEMTRDLLSRHASLSSFGVEIICP